MMMKQPKLMKYGIVVLAMTGLLLVAVPQTQAATVFSDGFDGPAYTYQPTGIAPGVTDPDVGIWDYHWYDITEPNIVTATGATVDGPSAAYAGDNYLKVTRGPGGASTNILAQFTSPISLASKSLHAEFQLFMKGSPWNLMSVGLVNDHGYTPWLPDASNYLVPFMFGDYAGDGRTDAYYYDGTGWLQMGSINDNAWNKVFMDWNHLTGKFTLTINDGTPWEAPAGALGTATSIFRLHIYPAPGLGFFDEIFVQNTLYIPPTLLEGDANRDGVVSGGDYASVQSHFGETGEPGILGDANGDGVVSAGDFASVQANFGSVAATVVTPEPATISLLSLGLVALLRRRK